ncbi:uncharacterized protein CPUR_08539 [Claviceps purpurea 20.1]|uniref:Uncharacterized protein n=2 Tax=Claviceps TaxID=5110 RepID=M1WD69_CLAP2|nr:hypothetical protein E4U34_004829 [Claviceps purpurea]CCE34605.1 uncharacterized protein CPUR_08539 [Claviceps purpurea 20.1]
MELEQAPKVVTSEAIIAEIRENRALMRIKEEEQKMLVDVRPKRMVYFEKVYGFRQVPEDYADRLPDAGHWSAPRPPPIAQQPSPGAILGVGELGWPDETT